MRIMRERNGLRVIRLDCELIPPSVIVELGPRLQLPSRSGSFIIRTHSIIVGRETAGGTGDRWH